MIQVDPTIHSVAADMSVDLVFRILLWLPVVSLLRLKSVCKCWYALIQSPDFVYKHHRHHRFTGSKHRFICLSWTDAYAKQPLSLSLISVDSKNNQASSELLDLPTIEDPYHLNPIQLVASCNGIFCLRQDRVLFLWNPATNQSTNLPSLPVIPLRSSFGFGFDDKTNDYKVLCIDSEKANPTVHLYSLISDSWTSIDAPVSSHTVIPSDLKTAYRNRFYCCWTWIPNHDGCSKMFLSFDFSTEVFQTMSLPEDGTLQEPSGLFILRENIACSNHVRNAAGVSCGYEIWTLKYDYNVKEYWTKLYSVSPSFTNNFCVDYRWMIGFSNNGDFLLLPMFETCFYDLVTQQVIDLSVHVNPVSQFLHYEESLVSVKRGNQATNIIDFEFQDGRVMMLNNQSMIGSNTCGDTDIPIDVLFHILLWLPVVSLLRFKSVCKSWCNRIKSSDFAVLYLHLHHHQNINDNVNLILHSYEPCQFPLFEDSSHPSCNTSCTCLLSTNKFELLDLPYSEFWDGDSLTIASSFDGIICLQLRDYLSIYLWNPATKQFKVVLEEVGGRGDGEDFSIGFGFDAKANDYKLVRIYKHQFANYHPIDGVQVYSLDTGSWRTIDDEILLTVVRITNGLQAPYRKGICCWLAQIDAVTLSHTILSFDLSQEVFRTIQLPVSIKKPHPSRLKLNWVPYEYLKLTVLRDNIACISTYGYYISEVGSWHSEIWMMNEFGVEESWTKLYKVGPFSLDWRLEMGYSKKNKDFVLLQKDGQLYTHDLVTQETRGLPVQIQGPQEYQVVLYKESLVPVRQGDC